MATTRQPLTPSFELFNRDDRWLLSVDLGWRKWQFWFDDLTELAQALYQAETYGPVEKRLPKSAAVDAFDCARAIFEEPDEMWDGLTGCRAPSVRTDNDLGTEAPAAFPKWPTRAGWALRLMWLAIGAGACFWALSFVWMWRGM